MLGFYSLSEFALSDYLQDLRSGRSIYFVSSINRQQASVVYICMNLSYTIEM